MRQRISSLLAKATMTLLLAVMTVATAWADTWPEYITDIILVGGSSSEVNAAKAAHSDYTFISKDLNDNAGGDYIYLGYKKDNRANYLNGGYITNFYISNSKNSNGYIDYDGKRYYLCPTNSGFDGDLNDDAGGDYIYLYYTKANFPDMRVVSNISFNDNSSNAVGLEGASGGYNLNNDAGGDKIYMHLTTNTKTNRPSSDPVKASNLIYDGTAKQLITTAATLASGTMYYRIGTSGEWKTSISQLTATNAGDHTVQYYAGSTSYSDASTIHSTTVTIFKAPNSGVTVSCANTVEGIAPDPQLVGNLSMGAVTYKYCTTQDGTYTTAAPTEPGTYWVKATVAADVNCNAYTTEPVSFTIRRDWALHNSGDSEADAYVISTTDELDLLAQRVNSGTDYKDKFFKLGDNITYSHTKDWDDATSTENNYTPIGDSNSHGFKGTFDGNGKTVSGIRISLKYKRYNGLFGYIDDGATVKNVIVSDARIIGWDDIGGIAGECCYSTITNCWVKSNVCIGIAAEIGGITGYGYNGTISGCRSEATLTAIDSDKSRFGGIVGDANSIAVSQCIVVGATIPDVNYRGAVVGDKPGSTLTNNYYTACTVAGVANATNVGCNGADANGARQPFAIGAATDVTITPVGTETVYDVSGITAYEGNNGIIYGGQLYAGAGETVRLNIAYTVPDGCTLIGFTDGNGNALADNGDGTYTLTMTSAAPTITPIVAEDWVLLNNGDSEADAYVIRTTDDLDLLAQRVNNGTSNYKGKFFKLADTFNNSKSPMTTTIGTESNPFAGTFNGNGKTLTVNINETSTQGTAPFRNICDGAVIKNLTVTGSVTGTTHAAGLVGFSRGGSSESPNTIEGCTVNVNVNVSVSTVSYKHMGGVVGHALTSYLKIKNTVYGGTMYNNDHYAGGLQGWSETNHLTIDNCLFKGSYTGSGKFHPVAIHNSGKTTMATVSKCYYTAEPTLTDASYIAAEGALVSTTTPASLYRPVTAADGNGYYTIVTVSGLRNYIYTGAPITISYTVKDGETTLVEGTHYTTELRNSSNALISKEDGVYKVTDKDTYTMRFTGISPCGGTLTKEFMVGDYVPLTSEMKDWTEVSYKVLDDVTIKDRITVTGNVRLYLEEGKTLTANKGISVESGNTLTIEGKGTLNATGNNYNAGIGGTSAANQSEHGHIIINGGTINATGGYDAAGIGGGTNSKVSNKSSITINGGTVTAQGGDYGAGIGGGYRSWDGDNYGMPGTIVINGGQVTANGGVGAQGIGKGYNATGTTGSLTLGWTNESDFIEASGYNIDNISFAKGKFFVLDGTSTIATTSNIGGKKIVPSWPAPTDFAVAENGITNHTATLQWTGYSDSYTVSYRTAEGISPVISEGFENGIDGWTLRDCAGATGVSSSSSNLYAHSGNAAFRFHYNTTPPQYLISPELTDISEGMKLEFYYTIVR